MSSQYYRVTAYAGVPHQHEVEVTIPLVGPQGPAGPAGTGLETLTTLGDTLYRGASTGERLPIGTAGQILRVAAGGVPEWAAPAASGVTSVTGTAPIVSSGGATPAISVTLGSTANTVCAGDDARLSDSRAPTSHTHSAADITSGTLDIARIPTGTGSTEVAAGDHTHILASDIATALAEDSDLCRDSLGLGDMATETSSSFSTVGHTHELTSLAATGSTSGHVLTANGSGGVSFEAASGGGAVSITSSASDVLSVSSGAISGVDGNTIDSADPFVKWDDTAGKLTFANPLSRPSGAFYVGLAPTTTALGSNAVNIQSTRSGAANVASGSNAICIGAGGNTASGLDAISIGVGNQVSGSRSIGIGYANTASGQNSVALGNLGFATGVGSVGINEISTLRAQVSFLPFRSVYWGSQTTNDTATVLGLDVASGQRFTIASNTALAVDILLVARRSNPADKWLVARRFLGIRRDGSNNTSLIGSVQTLGTDQSDGSPTWSFALTADDTNEALQLEVTGASGETVQWRATAFYRVV